MTLVLSILISCGRNSIVDCVISKSNPGPICVPCTSLLIFNLKHPGFVLEMEIFTSFSFNGITMCLRASKRDEIIVKAGSVCFGLLVAAIVLLVNLNKFRVFQFFVMIYRTTT